MITPSVCLILFNWLNFVLFLQHLSPNIRYWLFELFITCLLPLECRLWGIGIFVCIPSSITVPASWKMLNVCWIKEWAFQDRKQNKILNPYSLVTQHIPPWFNIWFGSCAQNWPIFIQYVIKSLCQAQDQKGVMFGFCLQGLNLVVGSRQMCVKIIFLSSFSFLSFFF